MDIPLQRGKLSMPDATSAGLTRLTLDEAETIAIDPAAMAGGFVSRIETMLTAMLAQDGVRLSGNRRHANRRRAEVEGIALTASEATGLADLAARPVRPAPVP